MLIDTLKAYRNGYLSDDSILLIGNGPSPSGLGYGKWIDSFNTIVRFNSFDLRESKDDLGSRTTEYVVASPYIKHKEFLKTTKISKVHYHSWDPKDTVPDNLLDLFPHSRRWDHEETRTILREFNLVGSSSYAMSTGLLAILKYLKRYEKVYILGFDWWDLVKGTEKETFKDYKHHYLKDGGKIGKLHNPKMEYDILKPLVDLGVVVDLNKDSSLYNDSFYPQVPPLTYENIKTRSNIPNMLRQKKINKLGIELGVAGGYYSNCLLKDSGCDTLYSIDAWNDPSRKHNIEEYKAALDVLRPYGERSVVIRSPFEDSLCLFRDESVDFIYIDVYAHTGQDGGKTIYDWWSKVKPGGFFGGHDYSKEHFPLTYKFVNEFIHQYKLTLFVTNDQGFNSWFVFKPTEKVDKVSLNLTNIQKELNDPGTRSTT